jgi:hypothetical protein
MKRRSVVLAANCAVCALALALTSSAFAGDRGKSKHSEFGLSNGGNSSGGSSPSMKLYAGRSKSLSATGSNGNLNSSMFSKSLSTKSAQAYGQFGQGNSSLQNLSAAGGGNGTSKSKKTLITGNTLLGDAALSNSDRRPPHWGVPNLNQQSLADAVQAGNFKPIDSGIGNGTGGGTIKWPGKFKATNDSHIADKIKKHKLFPVENIRIGEPNGPGKGNGKGKNKDCHDDCDFPWWPIIVGGCYNGGGCNNNGNCHHHHDCYDNYHQGCYNPIVTYPSVTNIVIEQSAIDPAVAAQAALTPGIDLELLDVRLVDAGDAARNLGPRYRLVIGNRGTLPAGNFQLMLMASVDGTPKAGLPMATSEVAGLASRQVLAVDVRLPLATDLATMSKFIVVVDSAAQIGEPDENNNVAVLEREKIAAIDPTTVAVQ